MYLKSSFLHRFNGHTRFFSLYLRPDTIVFSGAKMNFEGKLDFLHNLGPCGQIFGKDLEEELDFLRNLDLRGHIFGKDLKKLFDGCTDCTIFLVVTRPDGDELYHPETLPEPDMSKLRNWIRCGDPTGLRPEWKSIKTFGCNTKVYLAGQDLGIDCTSVMDDMFAEEGGKKYTYTYGDKGVEKITHPQEYLGLCISSLLLMNAKTLTIA
jgi:hypothetical protein